MTRTKDRTIADFQTAVRAAMEAANTTPEELSLDAKVSLVHVQRIISGEITSLPHSKSVKRLEKALGLDDGALLRVLYPDYENEPPVDWDVKRLARRMQNILDTNQGALPDRSERLEMLERVIAGLETDLA